MTLGLLILTGALFLLQVLFIDVIVVISVRKMRQPEALLELIEHGPTVLSEGLDYADHHRWAEDHGFAPDMVADFRGAIGSQIIVVGVWRSRARHTFLSSYTTPQKICCEFITTLEQDAALTTTNTRDGLLFPNAPGRYVQAFDGLDLNELLRRHEEALAHLHNTRHLDPVARSESTDRLILESIRNQMTYVSSMAFWQLRGAWWYWVRRNWLNNKSITERFPV